MFFFFTSFLLASNPDLNRFYDIILDFKSSDSYLFINDDFIQLRTSLEQNSNILYTKNIKNNSISLNIALSNLFNKNHKLFLVSSISKCINVTSNITNIDQNDSKFEIDFISNSLENNEILGLTFYIQKADFIFFSNLKPNINIKVISKTNNQLLSQILPQPQRKNLILCYDGIDCQKQNDFSIDSNENYLTSINDDNFEKVFNELFPNSSQSSIEYIRLFFSNNKSPKIDFSFIPFDSIQDFYIFGYSHKDPQQIKLTNENHIRLISKWRIRNSVFLIEKETSYIDLKSVYNQNANKSLIKSISKSKKVIFPIDVKEGTENITFLVKKDTIFISEASDTYELQEDKENIFEVPNNITVLIKPGENIWFMEFNISFLIEDPGQAYIQFVDWDNFKDYKDLENTNIMFNFYSDKDDLNISATMNKKIKYRHFNFDGSKLIKEYPSSFVFYVQKATINKLNYSDHDIVFYSTDKDINDYIKNETDSIINYSLRNLTFHLDSTPYDANFDFSNFIDGDPIKRTLRVSFICSDPNIQIEIKDFSPRNKTEIEIINCTIRDIPSKYIISELISTDSYIKGNNLNIKHGTFISNLGMKIENIKFKVEESYYYFEDNHYFYKATDNVTLRIHTPNNFNVDFAKLTNKPCGVNLNFEAVTNNNLEIPINFDNDWENGDISINVSFEEKIIIQTVPKNINFNVYNLNYQKSVHQVNTSPKPKNAVICYESFECTYTKDFTIDNETVFISTINNDNFKSLINSPILANGEYDYIRFIFFDTNAAPYNVNLSDLNRGFSQIQLYSYDDNVEINLVNNATTNYKNWLTRHVSFAKNTNIIYDIANFVINDTKSVFDFVTGRKVHIENAIFHCKYGYRINGLKYVNNIDHITFELFPEDDKKNNYILSISDNVFIANGNLNNFNGNPIINPLKINYDFLFHVPSINNFTFYICRHESIYDDISIRFDDVSNKFDVQYVCMENECNKHFTYNIIIENEDLLYVNQGNCTEVTTIINQNNQPSRSLTPTQSFSPHFSDSEFFSSSARFSYTYWFSETAAFSTSSPFTYSSQFTPSSHFSKSSQFSESSPFSETDEFSETCIFSDSTQFSLSNQFEPSFRFSKSAQFSKSQPFSETEIFSFSILFTESHEFSYSDCFTKSSPFSRSSYFTRSKTFTPSLSFTGSSFFTKSTPFTPSNDISTLIFTKTSTFSESGLFSLSSVFSQSLAFTPSIPFHDNPFVPDQTETVWNSGSDVFIMTKNGISDTKENLDLNKYNAPSVNIVFESHEITITENEEFALSIIPYFVAKETGSSIKIDLKNSLIGIKTENDPRVILTNTESPLNIMNNKRGYSKLDIEYENINVDPNDIVNLVLRELNNNDGYLTLNVDQRIQSVSFSSLIMNKISSLQVRRKNTKSNAILLDDRDDDDEIVRIIVNNEISINRKSEATLMKVEIRGRLNVYDDCLLIFKKETIFEENSTINVNIVSSKETRQQPIIKFDGLLESSPSKIIINFDDKSKSYELTNYAIFSGTNFRKCLSFLDKFEFVNKDKQNIEPKCEYADDGFTHLVLSSEKKKKLNTFQIVGILIGCIGVIALIILIIIIIIQRMQSKENAIGSAHEGHNDLKNPLNI